MLNHKWQKIETFLKYQLNNLEKDLASFEIETESGSCDSGTEISETRSTDEIAQSLVGLEMDLTMRRKLEQEIKEIKKALWRIKNDSYGKCVKCGQEIEMARLKVLPTILLCLECSRKSKS